jgi:hypothetical protein
MEGALANAERLNEELSKWLLLTKEGGDAQHNSAQNIDKFVTIAKELETYFVAQDDGPCAKETLLNVSILI